jgi:hypothetical protein
MHLPFLRPGPARRLALFALVSVIRLKILAGEERLFREWGSCFAGHVAALAFLLAIWTAWGPAPAWRRWGIALLFLGFAIHVDLILGRFGFDQYLDPVYPLLCIVGMVALLFTAILAPLRDCLGSELLIGGIPSNRRRLRVLHLFGWIFLIAMPLALIRWLGGNQDGQLRLLLNVGSTMPSIFLAGAICVASVYAKKRWVLWTLVGIVMIVGIAWTTEFVVCHAIRYFRGPQGAWPGYADLRIAIRQAHCGFAVTLVADLVVLRLIGVRIIFAWQQNPRAKSAPELALTSV